MRESAIKKLTQGIKLSEEELQWVNAGGGFAGQRPGAHTDCCVQWVLRLLIVIAEPAGPAGTTATDEAEEEPVKAGRRRGNNSSNKPPNRRRSVPQKPSGAYTRTTLFMFLLTKSCSVGGRAG
jgi:hypothetical protein